MTITWSYLKPEFSGKPKENSEAHLLRTMDWMEAHNIVADQRVRRLSLTLEGETRLWYHPDTHFKVIGKNYKRGL